jgi:hypothetical protein
VRSLLLVGLLVASCDQSGEPASCTAATGGPCCAPSVVNGATCGKPLQTCTFDAEHYCACERTLHWRCTTVVPMDMATRDESLPSRD